MKKLFPYLLLMLIMPAMLSSCKKDKIDDEPSTVSEKWFFEKVVEEEYNSAGVVVNTETDTEWTVNDYLLLHTDGKFEFVQDGDKITGTYKIENSVMTLTFQETSTITTTITVTVAEKSASRFTFYSDETFQGVRYRSTVYLKK